MWREWQAERKKTGCEPAWAEAKAVMCLRAMAGESSHMNDALNKLRHEPGTRKAFAELEAEARRYTQPPLPGAEAPGVQDLAVPHKSTVSRLIKRLAETGELAAWRANIAMLKELKKLYPEIGRRIYIDGSAEPDWAQQKGSGGDPIREAALRAHCPHAGFRAIKHSSAGKTDLKPDEQVGQTVLRGRGKAWRGRYRAALVDGASGEIILGLSRDAAEDEAPLIVPLLSLLFFLWPELDGDVLYIAGDTAWDEDPWCRLLEVDYGIHPIFRLHRAAADHTAPNGASKNKTVAGWTHRGRLVCARHGAELDYDSFEVPSRDGLKPGQSADESAFRLRAKCTHTPNPCGRLGLQARWDWSKLLFYPNHPHGHLERYAVRQAALVRAKTVPESVWNRMRAGNKVMTHGGDRGRLRDQRTNDCLFALSCAGNTALLLADVRLQHGITLEELESLYVPAPESGDLPHAEATAAGVGPTTAAPTPAGRPALRVISGGRS